jgi:hypothetical protein
VEANLQFFKLFVNICIGVGGGSFCLSKNWTWIFNTICRDLFVLNGFRREVVYIRFVDIGGIVD